MQKGSLHRRYEHGDGNIPEPQSIAVFRIWHVEDPETDCEYEGKMMIRLAFHKIQIEFPFAMRTGMH